MPWYPLALMCTSWLLISAYFNEVLTCAIVRFLPLIRLLQRYLGQAVV